MRALRACLLLVGAIAVVAGCATRRPAPVVDRLPPPEAKPAPAAAVPARPDTYTVKRGDTLYSIALEHGVDWRDLAAWNQLSDPTRLRLGQTLVLRPPGAAPVAEGPAVVSPVSPSAPIAGRPLGESGAAAPPGPVAAAPAAGAAAPSAAAPLKTEPKGVRLPYSDENLALLQRGDAAPRAGSGRRPDRLGLAGGRQGDGGLQRRHQQGHRHRRSGR